MNDYDLASWLISVRDIMAQREFISKQDAEEQISYSIDFFTDQYEGGYTPMESYMEYAANE